MRVFVTVGSMLPFDRLISAMDAWAEKNPEVEVFAQIGESLIKPRFLQFDSMISPDAYRHNFQISDLVVSHVGMGTVITAFETEKPLIMLPRRFDRQEVTSNHQVATAKWLEGRPGIYMAWDESELASMINQAMDVKKFVAKIESGTCDSLVAAIRQFIIS